MAAWWKSDDVLIPFHEGMESHTKLVKAFEYRNVRDYVCKASLFFEEAQFILEPLNLLSRILPIFEQPPVLVVAGLCVQWNNFAFWVERHWLWIVAVHRESLSFFFREPVWTSPVWLYVIDRPVRVRFREVLHVYRPCIMISQGWVHLHFGVFS